jgi:hypothetical protein
MNQDIQVTKTAECNVLISDERKYGALEGYNRYILGVEDFQQPCELPCAI